MTDAERPAEGCVRYGCLYALNVKPLEIANAQLNKKLVEAEALVARQRDQIRYDMRTLVLEQRCERGTPWDLACVTIADKIMSAEESLAFARALAAPAEGTP